jgi:hypothetical protein
MIDVTGTFMDSLFGNKATAQGRETPVGRRCIVTLNRVG